MAHYIIQVIFFQLCFLLMYELLLKKETFFSYNRWYLLLTPAISLVLPFLKIGLLGNAVSTEAFVMLPQIIVGNELEAAKPVVESSSEANFQTPWWLLVYGGGLLVAAFLFLKKFSQLKHLFGYRVISEAKNYKIIEIPQSRAAFSFYNCVFIGENLAEAEKQNILGHELVHVKQKHSLDLLFFEIQKIIFWFNPLVYIYQNRISIVHEFLADAQVVKTTPKQSYYQQLLNTAFGTQDISFINQFLNHSLIKERIVMLQKSKSKSVAKFKYLFIFPLMLAMLTYVACTTDAEPPVQETSQISQEDEQLKENLWLELKEMEANGADFFEISDAFMVEKDKHIKSKEAFYRFHTFTRWIYESRKSRNGFNEKEYEDLQKALSQTYEEYVAYRNSVDATPPSSTPDAIPVASIETVPTYPGCEDLASNEEMKNCMAESISEYVNSNFNAQSVMAFAEDGLNRIFVTFVIDKTGKITNIKARASSKELEAEAKRVILGLPQMEPGKNNGENIAVQYALPIIFQK